MQVYTHNQDRLPKMPGNLHTHLPTRCTSHADKLNKNLVNDILRKTKSVLSEENGKCQLIVERYFMIFVESNFPVGLPNTMRFHHELKNEHFDLNTGGSEFD